jgi:hypothetical protein
MNRHDITEILLKMALNTITPNPFITMIFFIVDVIILIYLIPVILLRMRVMVLNATFNNISALLVKKRR